MKPVYLVDYGRSAFTRAHPFKPEVDLFADIRGDQLLAKLIDNILAKASYGPAEVEDITVGCALPVKEQWNFGGRYPIYLSTLGEQCSSRSIDQQCGSGLSAIGYEALKIASGAVDIAMAGGYEHMTRVPMGPTLFKEGILTVPEISEDDYDVAVVMNMGLTAENLAQKANIGRTEMDDFACSSHQKATAAKDTGFFDQEIVPLENNAGLMVEKDACVRAETTYEKLSQLRSVFKEGGLVTAGNSSPLTTGAALCVLMSEEAMARTGKKPLARIVACADHGTKPELMGQGVVPAVEKALRMADLAVDQIGYWEINEAFSVVPLYAMKTLGIDEGLVNVNGGALAIGHPMGASGIRLAGTLAHILRQENGRYGCATACIGGGQGIALIIERL
ncbi:MAG: acetyl-CoA acetyltransferase [Alphaproteobacteria bacterium]|nr:MAG: acetyl-CoA acetyltransferase [Alphaproteobacteria bacterium]